MLVRRPPLVVRETHVLREADVGRQVVMGAEGDTWMVGIVTCGDLLAARACRLREAREGGRPLRRKGAA